VIERRRILPPFSERVVEFRHGGSTNFKLDVVPRRAFAVARVQFDDLGVTVVDGVVSSTVTEIDSPDESNVTFNERRITDEHHLLMVRSSSTYSAVEQHFATGLSDFDRETSIFLRAERQEITVGTPKESPYVDTAATSVGQECRDGGPVIGYALVPVSSPIRKANLVVGREAFDGLSQTREIRGAFDEDRDEVALGPRHACGLLRIDLGHRIAPLFWGQEPVVKAHNESIYSEADTTLSIACLMAAWAQGRGPNFVLHVVVARRDDNVRRESSTANTPIPDIQYLTKSPAEGALTR
jgi:hypothetical protein